MIKIDDIGKIYQQFTSNLDKLEKSLIERDIITSSTNLNLNSSGMLSINPVVTWNIACNEILGNLENISKLKQDLNTYIDSTNSLKKQALALELNLKEMSKTKEINDRKLGEAFHQIGRRLAPKAEHTMHRGTPRRSPRRSSPSPPRPSPGAGRTCRHRRSRRRPSCP